MSAETPPGTVDEVRERLRRLGYLDRGLDRFVLAGAAPASPARASARVALRLGAAGGVLFGTALALIAASLRPGLLRTPADLAVLAAYLVVLLSAVVGLAAFAAGWLLARAVRGRRVPPGLSRNAGFTLALLALAYLALWWRSHAIAAPWTLQATVLVIALGLGLLLGRFGSLAVVAVLSAAGVTDLPRAPLTRRHLAPLVAAAALLFAGALAAASWTGPAGTVATPAFAVVPTGVRVRVIGVDGLGAALVEEMAGRGVMPRLDALRARAASGRVQPEPQAVPAIVWTTVATGRGPEAHGMVGPGQRRLAGMRTPVGLGEDSRLLRTVATATDVLRLTRAQPVTSALRSVKAFWNVASEKGLRVVVVNWWATWPADPVNGVIVTDRALFKLEKGGADEREALPAEVWPQLASLAAAPAPAAPAEVDAALAPEWSRAARIDAFHAAAAAALRASGPADVEALYLPGLDIVSMQLFSGQDGRDVASLARRLDAITRYCAFLDGLIGEAAADAAPEQAVLLLADPGRLGRGGKEDTGLLLALGGPFTGGDLGTVSERDLAPTVMHLAGLPVSDELEGRVLEAALAPPFRAAHPVRRVASYGSRPPAPAAESAFDRDTLEQLRSLGYIH